MTHYVGSLRSITGFVFQIEGTSLEILNCDMPRTGGNPVLEIDESDDEIEFKPQPNVTRVVKRRSLS